MASWREWPADLAPARVTQGQREPVLRRAGRAAVPFLVLALILAVALAGWAGIAALVWWVSSAT